MIVLIQWRINRRRCKLVITIWGAENPFLLSCCELTLFWSKFGETPSHDTRRLWGEYRNIRSCSLLIAYNYTSLSACLVILVVAILAAHTYSCYMDSYMPISFIKMPYEATYQISNNNIYTKLPTAKRPC